MKLKELLSGLSGLALSDAEVVNVVSLLHERSPGALESWYKVNMCLCMSELMIYGLSALLCIVTLWVLISLMSNKQSQEQSLSIKLSCGAWEHCADSPWFALRILLMVLN